jgi:hypothetical protein
VKRGSLQPGNRGSRQGPGAARCCQGLPVSCFFPDRRDRRKRCRSGIRLVSCSLAEPRCNVYQSRKCSVLFQWTLPASSLWRSCQLNFQRQASSHSGDDAPIAGAIRLVDPSNAFPPPRRGTVTSRGSVPAVAEHCEIDVMLRIYLLLSS